MRDEDEQSESGPAASLTATTPRQRRRAFALLFACLMTSGMGSSILFAVLPPIARELELTEFSVGLVYTVSAVLFIVMSQVWGRMSDRFGRRPIILIGLIGYASSTIVFAGVIEVARGPALALGAAWVVALLTLARGLFGAIGSAAGPAAQAYVADRTAPGERTEAIAALTAAFGFGAALGPGLAGWLAPRIGLVAPLYLIAAFALAGAVAVRAMLPERTPPRPRPGGPRAPSVGLALDPRLRGVLAAGVLAWAIQGAALQTVNFYVMDRMGVAGGEATQLAGAALTASALAMLAAQLGVIRVTRPRPRAAIFWGACATLIGSLLMAFAHAFGEIIFAAVLTGFGMGLCRPGMAAAASLAVEPHEQGAAAGLSTATAGVGFLLAPFTGLWLYQTVDISAPFVLSSVFAAAVIAIALFHPSVKRASQRAR